MQDLAVIVVNYRTPALTIACLEALEEARPHFRDFRVVVVDGASGDGSADRIADAIARLGGAPAIELVALDVNGGFGFANNRGIFALRRDGRLPEAIALINPDARVHGGALEAMAALLDAQPHAGAVGGLLVRDDGSRQASAFRFPTIVSEFCSGAQSAIIERLLRHKPITIEADEACEVPWVTGAAVMFRTAALQASGLFDEGFFLYYEETELMHRLRRHGWTVWHTPHARIYHADGASTQVNEGDAGQPMGRPMPHYWYHSRRRYFSLTGGRGRALLASLAWMSGRLLWLGWSKLTGKRPNGPGNVVSDLMATGLWPSTTDAAPAIATLSGDPAKVPAWQRTQRGAAKAAAS